MTITVRTLAQAELLPALHVLEKAFGGAPHPDDEQVELSVTDPARMYGAFAGDSLVATAGSFDLTMTVPGVRCPWPA
jgi:hypothetical protein